MTTRSRPRLRRGLARIAAVGGLAALVAGCGRATASPEDVEACLRQEGLAVARQPGVSPPVETKINFDIGSASPDPERSGAVIFYSSEGEAARQLRASGGSGPKGTIEHKGNVLYTPFGAQASNGRTAQESRAVVESCVMQGQADEAESDGKDRKRTRSRRR